MSTSLTPWCQSRSRGSRAVGRPPGLRSWDSAAGAPLRSRIVRPNRGGIVTCEQSSGNLCRGRTLWAGDLASQSSLLQFAVTFLNDDQFESLKLGGRGDGTDRGMQSNGIVVVSVAGRSPRGAVTKSPSSGLWPPSPRGGRIRCKSSQNGSHLPSPARPAVGNSGRSIAGEGRGWGDSK